MSAAMLPSMMAYIAPVLTAWPKIEIAVHAVTDARNDLRRKADAAHLRKHASHRMAAQQSGPIRPRQEGDDLLQHGREARNGHIGPADKAVPRAHDRSDRAGLPVRRKREDHAGRQRCAEQHQDHHVQQHEQHVRSAQIPARQRQITEAGGRGDAVDEQRGAERRQIIAQREDSGPDRRNGQVVPCTGDLVEHHGEVRAEGHRHTADGQQRRDELPADTAMQERVLHLCPGCRKGRAERTLIRPAEEGDIEHQQDHRRDEGGEEHALILEIQLAVAPDQRTESGHFSAPPASFCP